MAKYTASCILSVGLFTLVGITAQDSLAKSTKKTKTAKEPTSETTQTDTTTAKPNAKADWTPLLQSMQNGCDLPDFDNLSPQMANTIISNDVDKRSKALGDYKVLNLKNASAWGYPIKKIQYGSAGAGFSSATIYFNDARFMSLRPKFYIHTASGKLKASDKTVITDRNAFAGQYLANGMGYNDGRVGVNFSKKTNSITCSWAHLTS